MVVIQVIVNFSQSVLRRIDIRETPIDRFCWGGIGPVGTTGTAGIRGGDGGRASDQREALGAERNPLGR
jgi:hypothetical protein